MRRFLAAPALSTGLALTLALGVASAAAVEAGTTTPARPAAAAPAAQPARPAVSAGPARPAAPAASASPAPAEESAAGPTSTRLPGLAARPAVAAEFPRPPADPAARRAWLKTTLDETFSAPPLSRAKVGVLVVEADTGKPLYARGDKTALNAASNVKIVTSASALALLGPDYRWKTTISMAANGKSGAEVAGDLYLRGFGDPTLTTEDLASLAGDLWAEGIRRVKGTIVADETFFDGTHVGPAYEQKSDSTASRAPSAGLSLNGNLISVTIVPASKAGGQAKVLVEPPSAAFVVQGRVITTSSGPAPATVETSETEGGRTQITVSGRVRAGAEPRVYRRRVTNPPLYAAYTLKALLERRGITIAQAPHLGVAPAQGLRVLATNDSPPLGVVVHDLNKRSNNFTAEQVLRTMGAEIVGRPGTWEKGLDAVGRYLATLGIRKGSYQMMNGSGLYDSNRFTPEQMVTVLRGAMRDFRISAEFMASLSIAGTDGTIGHRMGGTPAERFVRAKTGTLATASCLSGFAGSPGHAPLIFSILMNDLAGASDARAAQDRAAELLVAYIEADNPK
ncbi:MAG TPA: D-alanyl-D-alanine carboxypeptidase/D-alanyl-D-alanine-endopeptidase [Polyangia bacterium]